MSSWKWDESEVSGCGIHKRYWTLCDRIRGEREKQLLTMGIFPEGELNKQLAPITAKVNCIGGAHNLILLPTGEMVMLAHLRDKKERKAMEGLASLGGLLSSNTKRKHIRGGLCRCERVYDAYQNFMRTGEKHYLSSLPEVFRHSAKARRDTIKSRRAAEKNKRFPEPEYWGMHNGPSPGSYSNGYQRFLHVRQDAYRDLLKKELLSRCELAAPNVWASYSWAKNFWKMRGRGRGGLYRDGFFYTVDSDNERVLVVSQKTLPVESWNGFEIRQVLFLRHGNKDFPFMGTALRKLIPVRDEINPREFLWGYGNENPNTSARNNRQSLNPWMVHHFRRALVKRFPVLPEGEHREVLGWEIHEDIHPTGYRKAKAWGQGWWGEADE